MSTIKDGRYPVQLNGKTYHLLFSLNVLDEVQDKFGGYDKLSEAFNQSNPNWIKNTKWLFALLLNEGAEEGEPQVTEQQVGKWLHMGNLKEIQMSMLSSFAIGTRGTTEPAEETEDENDEGNQTGGQV